MEGFFVFNIANDLIYTFSNELMNEKLAKIAKNVGLMREEEVVTGAQECLSSDVLMQIFNPLLANLRFMLIQFDNSFNYVKCKHGFNMVFDDESFGYLFITISDNKSIEFMQRSQGVFKSFVRHLVGPLVYQLRSDNTSADLLTKLIVSWNRLYFENQDVCIEAIEQLSINNDVKKSNLVSTLEQALDKLKQDPQLQRSHAILFHGNKFLTMFSARSCSQQLTPADIFFLNLLVQTVEMRRRIDTKLLFMRGSNNSCVPYKVNRIAITEDITLLLLSEYGNTIISTNMYEAFLLLNKIKVIQSQIDLDSLVIETEKLDKCIKGVIEVEKKTKHTSQEIEESAKNFQNKYEILRKKYVEMLKVMDKGQLLKVESHFPLFMEAAKELYKLTYFNENARRITADQENIVFNISAFITDRVAKIAEFLQVKARNNFAVAYLEDFAGLVHFIFVDRQRGTCIFPDIDATVRETSPQIKKKVWEMVETARNYLQNGQTTVIWKDFAFSYHYSLWFEDANGQSLKPKDQTNALAGRQSMVPGIVAHDFYQRLTEAFFPKISNGINKIKVFELLTIHLNLVTPHLQLEHSRRLIATISDEVVSNNLFDLL